MAKNLIDSFEFGTDKEYGPPVSKDLNISEIVNEALAEAQTKLAPLWDTRDYVAVNPLFGYKESDFLEAVKKVYALTGVLLLPHKSFLKLKYESSEIQDRDLEQALDHLQRLKTSSIFKDISMSELFDFVNSQPTGSIKSDVKIKCLSDQYDAEHGTDCTKMITKEISKWAAAYFDEGQSIWEMPLKEKRLFKAWKSLVQHETSSHFVLSRVMELAKTLPSDPNRAITLMCSNLLKKTMWDENRLSDYFLRQLLTIQGWSSFVKKIDFEKDLLGDLGPQDQKTELIDLLAIRMAYDLSFLSEKIKLKKVSLWNKEALEKNKFINQNYVWLMTHEGSVRKKIISQLHFKNKNQAMKKRPLAQMAFCIDVRSEVIRRHLEISSEEVETVGFAGFFGLPISVKKIGFVKGDTQCPVLIKPALEVSENALDPLKAIKQRVRFANEKISLRGVNSSSNSSFAMAETFGFSYAWKMLKNALGLSKPNINIDVVGNDVHLDDSTINIETKVELAFNALTNMGLVKRFAKYVFFFGHGGESANNPYESALDCGACAGHNGKSNASLLASLLNDAEVRKKLTERGVEIPEDTVFLSGWHNTTKDILNVDKMDEKIHSSKDFESLNQIMGQALERCRLERAQHFYSAQDLSSDGLRNEMKTRAQDWSEIRPEWGLARNHSFIVAGRSLTREADLQGRSFLHDYDESTDPDLKKLELIMTAPMVVTNWINMQYFASTIDTERFGAGNKTINNVVGTIGCIQGNEGDLLGGLTEQSVRYDGKYFHEPLRLQVFIQAKTSSIDKIIAKHQMVSDLVSNGWVSLIAISTDENKLKLRTDNQWLEIKEELWN